MYSTASIYWVGKLQDLDLKIEWVIEMDVLKRSFFYGIISFYPCKIAIQKILKSFLIFWVN